MRFLTAFFRIYFLINVLILYSGANLAMNSINIWSKKGERLSKELAILAISTLTNKSFGRYVMVSVNKSESMRDTGLRQDRKDFKNLNGIASSTDCKKLSAHISCFSLSSNIHTHFRYLS